MCEWEGSRCDMEAESTYKKRVMRYETNFSVQYFKYNKFK